MNDEEYNDSYENDEDEGDDGLGLDIIAKTFSMFQSGPSYGVRKVDRYEGKDFFISTAGVPDSTFPYETAVKHPNYNGGSIVIVENYNTIEEAKEGHKRWVGLMTAKVLPEGMVDVGQAGIARLADRAYDNEEWRIKPKKS